MNNTVARIREITQVDSMYNLVQNHPVFFRGKRREIDGSLVMCRENSIIVTRLVKEFKSL